MKSINKLKIVTIIFVISIFTMHALSKTSSGKNIGGVMTISDGKGNLELIWYPPVGKWPTRGWKILDEKGKIIKKNIRAGNKKWIAKLNSEDVTTANNLIKLLSGKRSISETKKIFAILAIKEFTIHYFAKAMGLYTELKRVPKGLHRYRVVGISGSGENIISLKTISVNGYIKTPIPDKPVSFKGEPKGKRVALFWGKPAFNRGAPVFSHLISRQTNSGKSKILTPHFLILNSRRDPKEAAFYDMKPVFEEEVIYSVENIDVFGRHSEASFFSIVVPDPVSKFPPVQKYINIGTEKGSVILGWKPKKNKFTMGYIIERSNSRNGIYKILTKQYLSVNTSKFKDRDVTGGTTYYYRIRSIRTDGYRGDPSFPVAITAKNANRPSRIGNLSAKAGRTRVHLQWTKSEKFPVAGYLIERKSEQKNWERINSSINQLTYFDDNMERKYSGTFYYRVTAIAFDNQQSIPSKPVKVFIPSRVPPPSPYIENITGTESKSVIIFKPAYPSEKSAGFYILRGGSANEKGIVISEKLTSGSRKYIDTFVTPGRTYWYKVVAVGKNSLMSAPSDSVSVSISDLKIPVPDAPALKLISTPFTGIKILFKTVPEGLNVIVERKSAFDKSWIVLLGPTKDKEIIDTNPPEHGEILYRIVFQSPTGAIGEPSQPAMIKQ